MTIEDPITRPSRATVVYLHDWINGYLLKYVMRHLKSEPAHLCVHEELIDKFFFDIPPPLGFKMHSVSQAWKLQFFKSERHLWIYYYILSCNMMQEFHVRTTSPVTTKEEFDEYCKVVVDLLKAWKDIFYKNIKNKTS